MPPKKNRKKQKPTAAMSNTRYAEHLNNYNSIRDAIEHQYMNRTKPLAPKPKMRLQIT